jgi:histone H3/H4
VERTYWKHCSTCKKEIPFRARYHACNVSTCNRGHTALAFCSVECWDSHVPLLRHRDAWAVEQTAPSREEWQREQAEEQAAAERREARAAAPPPEARPLPPRNDAELPRDVLIVVSKLKAYVRARSGMNTSDAVIDVLSDKVRELCDRALEKAAQAGRKTLLDRDF